MSKLLGPRDGWGLVLLGIAGLFIVLIGVVVSYDPIPRAAAMLRPWLLPTDCDPNCSRDLFDLSAQQSMAFAAWAMVVVSAVSLGIGIWSVFLIRQNLVEARKITAEATKTTRASEEAVAAAQATNLTTLTLGKAQVRAYIAVSAVSLRITPTGCYVDLSFANSGQSPARRLKLHTTLMFSELDLDGETWGKDHLAGESYFFADMPASERKPQEVRLDRFLSESQIKVLEAGRSRFEIMCNFTYVDVFEDRWEELSYFREYPPIGFNWRAFELPMPRRPEPSARSKSG